MIKESYSDLPQRKCAPQLHAIILPTLLSVDACCFVQFGHGTIFLFAGCASRDASTAG